MKSKIFALCCLVLTVLSSLNAQEQSQTFSPLGIRTVRNVGTEYSFTGDPNNPNPIGRLGFATYRTGASFDISPIPNDVWITRAELIIDLRKGNGVLGSEVKITKVPQNVNNYTSAPSFWNDIGSGNTYRSNVSPYICAIWQWNENVIF
jgi:hypothetical protein